MEQSHGVFRIRNRYLFWRWAFLLFFLSWTTGFTVSTLSVRHYPDLNDLPFIYLITGFCCVVWVGLSYRQTIYVQLADNFFAVKKAHRPLVRHTYTAILGHNERLQLTKGGTYREFTVYLTDNWFAIQSNQFKDYDYLRDQLTRYGQPVPYRDVITPTERNWLGGFIGGLGGLILITIALGFALHNSADPNPARLVTITDTVDQIRANKHKGRLTGLTISLRSHSQFAFIVSRRNYDVSLHSLASTITPVYPISLLIRQSEFRKKLKRTQPLTFGDKYDGYRQIRVFGVTQGDSVRLQTSQPVYEPTHTNPLLQTFLLSILLLLCWTGWVYVDRLPVLR
jgi:hypothetical protein